MRISNVFIAVTVALSSAFVPVHDSAAQEAKKTCKRFDVKCLKDMARAAVSGNVPCAKNDTYQCAKPIASDGRIEGVIGANNRVQFYRMNLSEPSVIVLTLSRMPNRTAMWVKLSNDKYEELGQVHYEAGQPGERLLQVASAGTYYLHLAPTSYPPAEPFLLSVTTGSGTAAAPVVAPTPTPPAEPTPSVGGSACNVNNTFQCATVVALDTPIAGIIGANSVKLIYRLTLTKPGVLALVMNPMPTHTGAALELVDAQYRPIGNVDYPAGQPGERLLRVASPGTYYLHLRPMSYPPAERFTLRVTQTP